MLKRLVVTHRSNGWENQTRDSNDSICSNVDAKSRAVGRGSAGGEAVPARIPPKAVVPNQGGRGVEHYASSGWQMQPNPATARFQGTSCYLDPFVGAARHCSIYMHPLGHFLLITSQHS